VLFGGDLTHEDLRFWTSALHTENSASHGDRLIRFKCERTKVLWPTRSVTQNVSYFAQ